MTVILCPVKGWRIKTPPLPERRDEARRVSIRGTAGADPEDRISRCGMAVSQVLLDSGWFRSDLTRYRIDEIQRQKPKITKRTHLVK